MADTSFISVIIATLNRPSYVRSTIRDLAQQSHLNTEIIVVDQSPDADSIETCGPDGRPVIYVRDDGRGAARARNAGIRAARGDIFVFLDDDVEIPGSDFLAHHARAYEDPTVSGVCGRTLERREHIRRAGATGTRPQVYPIICVPSGDTSIETRAYVNNVKGMNMSFRASVVRDIGGFDERFGYPCIYEETDVALKVCARGYRILFCPEAMLYHIGAPSGGQRHHTSNADRRFVAYRDRVLLFRNNYPMWQFPFFVISNLLLAMRPIVFFRGREVTRSWAGLLTGIRQFVLASGLESHGQ